MHKAREHRRGSVMHLDFPVEIQVLQANGTVIPPVIVVCLLLGYAIRRFEPQAFDFEPGTFVDKLCDLMVK